MGTYTWFRREKDIGMRDRALYEYMAALRDDNEWAALIADYYENPTRKPHNARNLKLPKPKKKDGLPPFTFAVFDGCKLCGYWDTEAAAQLKPILRALGSFAKPPRPTVTAGRAFFDAEGQALRFVLLYTPEGNTLRAFYDAPVELSFDRAKLLAPLPRLKK